MMKLIASIIIGFAPIFAFAEDAVPAAAEEKPVVAQEEHKGEAKAPKAISEELKKVADSISEKRKSLPENVKKELKEFHEAKSLPKEEKHKKYSSLSPEAKKALKEERKMKKGMTKDDKNAVDEMVVHQEETVSASE